MEDRDKESILKLLSLAEELLALADRGELETEVDSRRILFTLVRDCAFKIRAEVQRELRRHRDGQPERPGREQERKE